MVTVLLLVIIILLVASMTLLMRGGHRYSTLEFYARGKEAGFNTTESNFIKKIAKQIGIEDPTNVFWSIRDIDMAISAIAKTFKGQNTERKRENVLFMEKLYEFRKKMEFDQPKYHVGIRSSRMIRSNQRVKVLLDNVGVFSSTVIENTDRYLVITYPVGGRLPPNFEWKGARLSIYFWRQDDAGYVFDTYVLEDLRIRNIPVLQVGHSGALLRTQKRKSLRMRSQMPAYLYLLKNLEGAYEKPERVPGMKCIVQDLSEDGAALIIGGKAKVGLAVKIQVYVDDDQIVLSGTVRGADYNAAKNQSQLHIEAVPPSPRMSNLIRSHVYNNKSRDRDDGALLDGNVFSG